MRFHPFSDALIVVVFVLMFLALPYAAIETFGPEAMNVVSPFHIILAIFSAVLLVLTRIKYRLERSGAALKMLRRESSDHEDDGIGKDATRPKYDQQLTCMRSVIRRGIDREERWEGGYA